MKTYTTMQGDTWDGIAYRVMGSCEHTDRLMLRNRAYLDYFTFPAGIKLEIPEVAQSVASALPPWRRNAG